jgi:uncharacterized protein YegP (UPF0339 family)|tara:strand:+ start:319 stop:585 length:267 start_codon:yes stop_codon:yes gene_type:complete
MKATRIKTKSPLPEDYIVTYHEDGKYGFVYYAEPGNHRILYTANIFTSEDEAEKEAYEWMFAKDTDNDDRREVRFEMKHFFLEEASIH